MRAVAVIISSIVPVNSNAVMNPLAAQVEVPPPPSDGSVTVTVSAAPVIGGVVYRGSCFPDLVGSYFYGDYGQGGLWTFKLTGGVAMNDHEAVPGVGQISHVNHDATGEIYVVTMDGRVRRITAAP